MIEPQAPEQYFVRAWEPFQHPDGELSVGVYERQDGSEHLYFSSELAADAPVRPPDEDVSRIVFREVNGKAVLLGVEVERKMRGQGLGKLFVDYFVDYVESETGLTCRSTGQINKPVVALTLERAGFKPARRKVLAAILPQPEEVRTDTPKVHIVRNRLGREKLITGTPGGRWKFYSVVPPRIVKEQGLEVRRDRTVALNTRYTKLFMGRPPLIESAES